MSLAIRTSESLNSFLADGIQTVWPFSFSYLDPSHVKALVIDPSGNPTQPAITVSGSTATLTPPVASGYELTIYRATPTVAPMVDFTDKAMLSEASLDLNAKQAVYAAADARDWASLKSDYSNGRTAAAAAVQALASQVAAAASALSVVQSNLVHIAGAETVTGAKTFTSPLVATAGMQGLETYGQCRLIKQGANLLLFRCNGRLLTVNGTHQVIPTGGVTLAPTGLVANTVYFIYAFVNAGVLTLEASTTGHGPNGTDGTEVKLGDPTRTLVGMARPGAGPVWVDGASQRFVISWFNRRTLTSQGSLLTATGINTVAADRTATQRAEFLTWADEGISLRVTGSVSVATAPDTVNVAVGYDGAAASWTVSASVANSNYNYPICIPWDLPAAVEGYHYGTTIASTLSTSTGIVTVWNMASTRG